MLHLFVLRGCNPLSIFDYLTRNRRTYSSICTQYSCYFEYLAIALCILKHDISEIGSASVTRCRERKVSDYLELLGRAGLDQRTQLFFARAAKLEFFFLYA